MGSSKRYSSLSGTDRRFGGRHCSFTWYVKNFEAISLAEHIGICRSRDLICNCGGLGGVLVNLLARVGIGFLRLVDGDAFAPSNLNRQWLCDAWHLSQPKARVAEEQVRAINPLIEVQASPGTLDESNADDLLRGMDLAVGARDNVAGGFLADGVGPNAFNLSPDPDVEAPWCH